MKAVDRDISVIICTYTEKRWENLVAAINSVQQQTLPAIEVIVVIDHNMQLLKRVCDHISEVIVIENAGAPGLSGARNSGIALAKGQIVAFLDDDAVAICDWLLFLSQGFVDPNVLGTGGAIIPQWPERKVSWFPEEFLWVIGCTYKGMVQTNKNIRNLIGANMAFRREIFAEVGGFNDEVGRVGAQFTGCEETELCIRARQKWPEKYFLYLSEARVSHYVPMQRLTWRYFCARCYGEGISKARVTDYVGAKDGLASERTYIFKVLPKGILRGYIDLFVNKDFSGLVRPVAIFVGLTMTSTGYLVGKVQRLHNGSLRLVQTPSPFQGYHDTIGSLEHVKQ